MFGDELNTGIQNLITWFLLPRRWNGPSCKLHLCPRGVGDSRWENCLIGKLVRFFFLARWGYILFVLEEWKCSTCLWLHTAPRRCSWDVLPSGLQVPLKCQWLCRLPCTLLPVGIPKASHLNWLSSKSPEAQLRNGNLVSKEIYWCYNAWLKYIYILHKKILSSLLDWFHFLLCF